MWPWPGEGVAGSCAMARRYTGLTLREIGEAVGLPGIRRSRGPQPVISSCVIWLNTGRAAHLRRGIWCVSNRTRSHWVVSETGIQRGLATGRLPGQVRPIAWISSPSCEMAGGTNLVVCWDSVLGRRHTVYMSTNLLQSLSWTNIHSCSGNGLERSYIETNHHESNPRFFRLGVDLQ